MFDTSRIHPMLDKVQIYLGQWLEDHLKQIRPVDWWERCVLDVLVPEQRENVINDGAKNPSELDLSTQISVFRGNWLSLRRKFHLDPQLYDDAISVKRIRNKYSHKKSSENYESRFDHNLETVRLFLKGLGASIPETEEGELKKEGNAMDNLMTFDNIIEAARTALPDNIRRAPWIGLEHGVVPLDTEQKLDQYLAAYGKMHAEKIRMALNSLDDPEMLLSEPVSVVDWGCGQGLASCCLFDWLLNKKIDIDCISRVHLIEPSNLALQRAQSNIARYKKGYNCQFDVKTVNKVINNIQSDDFDICNINTTLHLFSNILDIETVDLKFLSKFITNTFTGRQIFCCVGPHNNGAPRITEFAGTFGITQAQIQAKCVGKLSHSKGTVCLLTFVIDIGKASIVKEARLDPASAVIEDNIALQRLLKRYTPEKDVLDRILQFYQMTTELEQLKEPEVKNSTPFVMGLNGDSIIVSFKNNCNDNDTTPFAAACRSFAEECDENTNRENRFPKDILCSLEIDLGGKIYRLLHYIKPVSELEGFDYKNDDFVIPLRDFALNIAATEALNISDQDVTALEQVLHSDNVTLNDIEAQIINVIGLPATFNKKHIELSLCQKSTTLLQTRAELKKIKAYSVFRNPLLEAFLKNAEIDNNIEPILPDELISAVPMDSSQRKAVAHALGNHVSVIIGPPGCGKTQLLLNLLANALVRGKKVLVASKNNKAVDNVCDRFKTFDEDGCFLRFGPKKYTKDKTLPVLSNLLNCVQAKNYDDTEYMEVDAEFRKAIDAVKAREGLEADLVKHRDGLASDQEDIVGLCNEIEAANKALKKIREECIAEIRVRFETKYQNQCNAVREYETRIVGLEREIDLERERLMRELDDFKEMHIGCASLEKFDYDALFAFIAKLQRIGSDIEYRIGGLRGIFVRKATIAKCVLDAVSELPWSIQEYLREVDTRCNIGDFDSRPLPSHFTWK